MHIAGQYGASFRQEIMPGPDFPTGATILGRSGIRSAYESGRGSVIMRGKVHTENVRGEREAIIITEIPYQVNKASMIEKIAELVREKRIEGISPTALNHDEVVETGKRVADDFARLVTGSLPGWAAALGAS